MTNNTYKKIITADGSPSLEWLSSGEAMHNRLGALSETVDIYGGAFLDTLSVTNSVRVLSVGLGLGYNEIMMASLCLHKKVSSIQVLSFEENSQLREDWWSWLDQEPCYLSSCYEEITHLFSKLYNLPSVEIKKFLQMQYTNNHWQLRERLEARSEFPQLFNCILYDPFSSKTNPECWNEDFLYSLFKKVCQPFCIVSTYSAKGTLKRSLQKLGFKVSTPIGFGGKRNRIYAVRSTTSTLCL